MFLVVDLEEENVGVGGEVFVGVDNGVVGVENVGIGNGF